MFLWCQFGFRIDVICILVANIDAFYFVECCLEVDGKYGEILAKAITMSSVCTPKEVVGAEIEASALAESWEIDCNVASASTIFILMVSNLVSSSIAKRCVVKAALKVLKICRIVLS